MSELSDTTAEDRRALLACYRAYCDACQSNHLEKLKHFWQVPAMFTIDVGANKAVHKIVETVAELEDLYGMEFGSASGVDQTIIDQSEVKFFGTDLATVQTSLRHLTKGAVHDRQIASYGCRKTDGNWRFISHISIIIKEANRDGGILQT